MEKIAEGAKQSWRLTVMVLASGGEFCKDRMLSAARFTRKNHITSFCAQFNAMTG